MHLSVWKHYINFALKYIQVYYFYNKCSFKKYGDVFHKGTQVKSVLYQQFSVQS